MNKLRYKNAAPPFTLITQLGVLPSLIRLIIDVVVFTPTYLTTAILNRTFNTANINNLREMLTALGPLQLLFNKILNLIEKLMTALTTSKKQNDHHPKKT